MEKVRIIISGEYETVCFKIPRKQKKKLKKIVGTTYWGEFKKYIVSDTLIDSK